jgi:hypothetical protein
MSSFLIAFSILKAIWEEVPAMFILCLWHDKDSSGQFTHTVSFYHIICFQKEITGNVKYMVPASVQLWASSSVLHKDAGQRG